MEEPTSGFALWLHECSKKFKATSGDEVIALDSVSLSIPRGEILALIGSNGAGKSTLFGAVAGSTMLDSGAIGMLNLEVTNEPSWKRAARVALVRQNPADNVCSPLTIEQNFAISIGGGNGRRIWSTKRAVDAEVRHTATERLALFGMGLEKRLRTPVNLLSGGQRQAVAVAMATARMPEVLLADEHTASLDPRSASSVLAVTEAIVRDAGITTILITHNMGVALRHSDRVILMHRGRIVLDLAGPAKDELDESGLIELFRRATGDAPPDRTLLS